MINSLFPITEHWSWGTFFLYYLISVLVVFVCKKGAQKNKHRSKESWNGYYWAAVIVLVLLATLRTDAVGPDTKYYVREFTSYQDFSYDWSRMFDFHQEEPGFQLINAVFGGAGRNYHILFFVIYSVVSFAYVYYIKDTFKAEDSCAFLPLLIFFFVSNMSGMRAAMGSSFLLISFVALSHEKYGKAIIWTLVGFLFHYSMIFNLYVIFALWFFKNDYVKRKRWVWGLFFGLSVVVSYFGMNALKGIFTDTKYNFYASVNVDELSIMGSLFFVLFGVVALIFYKRIMAQGENRKSVALLISLSFLLVYPAIFLTGAYRIPNYYAMPRLYIWSQCAQLHGRVYRTRNEKLLYNFLLHIVIVIYLLFRFTRSSLSGSFIYYFDW